MPETSAHPSPPASSTADLPLAHPNWVVYEQAAFLAVVVGKASEVPAKLRGSLRSLWRTPPTPGLEAAIDATVADAAFESEFVLAGGDPLAARCVRLLHALAVLGEHARPAQVLAELASAGAALAAALESGATCQPKLWKPEVRAERLQLLQGEDTSGLGKEERKQLRLAEQREAQRLREERDRQQREAEQARLAGVAVALQAWMQERGVGPGAFDIDTFDALQSGQLSRDFRDVHGMHPSPAALRKLFDLAPEVHEQLALHQAERERDAREKKLAQYRWEQTLVGHDEALRLLHILKAELDEWTALQRIPVALHRPARKGGPDGGQVLFDPAVLRDIPEERIAAWRAHDLETLPPQDRSTRARAVARLQARRRLAAAIDASQAAHQCDVQQRDDGTLVVTRSAKVLVTVAAAPDGAQAWSAVILLQASLPAPANAADVGNLPARVGALFTPERLDSLATAISHAVDDLVAEYAGALSEAQRKELLAGLRTTVERGLTQQDITHDLKNTLVASVSQLLRRIEEERAQELVRLKDYPQAFPLARRLERTIHFRLGPTN
ncbi:MAG TPA: hypothetical protein VIL30_16655, partial [Ramlibacter sp.]